MSAQSFYAKKTKPHHKKKKTGMKFSAITKFFVVLMISIMTAAIICVLIPWFNCVEEGREGRTKGKKQNCGEKNPQSDQILCWHLIFVINTLCRKSERLLFQCSTFTSLCIVTNNSKRRKELGKIRRDFYSFGIVGNFF